MRKIQLRPSTNEKEFSFSYFKPGEQYLTGKWLVLFFVRQLYLTDKFFNLPEIKAKNYKNLIYCPV